jgi:hypothetical protein
MSRSRSLLPVDRPDAALELLDRRAGIGDQAAVRARQHLRALLNIVLVFDLADDFLDDILDGHEAVDAAELVDHQGHVDTRQPHLQQQIERAHRRRNEQHLAQDGLEIERPVPDEAGEHVLYVDHAHDIIERLAVDRQPRVTLRAHDPNELRELDIHRHGRNIGARHHHVVGRQIAQLQDVSKQCAFILGDGSIVFGFGFLDQLFDGFAQRIAVAAAAQTPEPVPQPLQRRRSARALAAR